MNLAGLRVLLVEDEPIVRDIAAAGMRRRGMIVEEVTKGEEALKWLDWPPDVLFTDIRLPGSFDGFEVARLFRRRHPKLLVVYSTAYVYTDVPVEGSLFFQKPYDLNDVLTGIAGMTGRGFA
jgi:CheY-like chemotaxis protein